MSDSRGMSRFPSVLTGSKGNDLFMTHKISLLEALVGFEYSFKHLDGHLVELKRGIVTPPGFTQGTRRSGSPFSRAALPGEGMPVHGNAFQFGQLFVTYQINFPAKLTEKQKEGFKALLSTP